MSGMNLPPTMVNDLVRIALFNVGIWLLYRWLSKTKFSTLALVTNSLALYLYTDSLAGDYRLIEAIFYELSVFRNLFLFLLLVSTAMVFLGRGGKGVQIWVSIPYWI